MTQTLTRDTIIDRAWAELTPVFTRIARSAAQTERAGSLDSEGIAALRDAGYTRLRVPEAYGGAGLTLGEFYPFVVELGAADSNLVQALRAHLLHTEIVLAHDDPEYRDRWLTRLGEGAIVGNAVTEVGNAPGESLTKITVDDDGRWRLNGRKFYSTGSLYADWIQVTAEFQGTIRGLAVPATTEGIELHDDWEGFGQRLTASGTTVFSNVLVDPREVAQPGEAFSETDAPTALQALAQTVHLAALTGITRAVEREFVRYVQGRRRSFSHATTPLPADDPQVLQVLGEVSAAAYGTAAIFGTLIDTFEGFADIEAQGATVEDYARLDIATYQAHQIIAQQCLWAVNHAFNVGGASATSQQLGLDRLWRNARVLAQHNPVIYRNRIVGDYLVNGTAPGGQYTVATIPEPPSTTA